MNHDILIGCDVGTSGAKAVATLPDGTILASAHTGYGLLTPHPGWAEQWPDVWLDALVKVLREVTEKVPRQRIAAVQISALYGGTGVLCDDEMQPLRPTIIWMDRRADKESRDLSETIGNEKIFSVSRNGIDSYFGFVKLLWVKRHEPETFSRIRHILPVHSYLVYKLTGELCIDYCSAGNIGGIYDYEAHGWSTAVAASIGIDPATLPDRFGTPNEIAGTLIPAYAEMLGISSDVPVCFGTVDCVASMLSAGITGDGDNAAVLGTSLNWGYIRSDLPTDSNLISMPYCLDPLHKTYTYGGASTAGALPRWFMQKFMQDESASTYEALEQAVERTIPPGSDGLMVLPYFMGERTPIWDENASGLMLGLSLLHTKEHIYRAILESTAYALRDIMESMTDRASLTKLVLVGGGSRSRLWRQIFADVTGLPVYTPKNPVEAPLGDAFMAAMAVGLVRDPKDIEKWVTFQQPERPDAAAHARYTAFFQVYKSLYPALKDSMKSLKQLSFS